MQKVLKNVIWACLFFIPFIAFYVADGTSIDILHAGTSGLYFPFISGKNFVFRAVVEIAFAAWILLAVSDAKYRPKKSPLLLAYGAFIFIIFLADIFGVDTWTSMWSNYERMEGFVAHIHFFAYFIILISMLSSVAEWNKLFKVFVFSNILVMIPGFMQLLGAQGQFFSKIAPALSAKIGQAFPIHQSSTRLDSTLGNSAYYAIYCLLFAFISAILFSQTKEKSQRWFYGVIVLLNVISLFYSGTRGTMIGFLGGVIASLGVVAWHEKGRVRLFFFGTLLALTLAVGSIFVFKNSSFVQSSPTLHYFSTISATSGTGMSRITIWKMSYEGWKERPILGYGQDNFQYVFPREFVPEKMYNQEPWFDRSHDVFFDWLIAGGILGLLSYLSLFAAAGYLLWRRKGDIPLRERALITGALVGYFIHNIFVFDNLVSYILFFMLLAYIVVRSNTEGAYAEKVKLGEWKDLLQPVVGVLFLVTFYYVTYLPHLTNELLISGMDVNRLVQTKSFEEVLKHQKDTFSQALDIGLLGRQEVEEQLFQVSSRMIQYKIPDTATPQQKQAIVQAENDFILFAKNHAEKMLPYYKDNIRMLDIIGMFYIAIGDGPNAEKVLTQAATIAPKKQLLIFDLIRSKMIQNKFDESYALAVATYNLQPQYDAAQKFLIITGIYAHKVPDVTALLAKNNQTIAMDNDVLSSLVSTGQKGIAIDMLYAYKKQNPVYASQIDDVIKKLESQ